MSVPSVLDFFPPSFRRVRQEKTGYVFRRSAICRLVAQYLPNINEVGSVIDSWSNNQSKLWQVVNRMAVLCVIAVPRYKMFSGLAEAFHHVFNCYRFCATQLLYGTFSPCRCYGCYHGWDRLGCVLPRPHHWPHIRQEVSRRLYKWR